MMSFIKHLFVDTCPQCKLPLHRERSDSSSIKSCPHGHYKEETHDHLGVIIVYDAEQH